MKKSKEILFEQLYGERPLFDSQQEFVNLLLSEPESGYYTPNNSEDYQLKVNRLKTYLSQLLSESVSRKVTPVFRRSLEKLINIRLKSTNYNSTEISHEIISSLAEKNRSANNKALIPGFNPKKDLIETIEKANYVLVITARPFDISDSESKFSIQSFLIQDLFDSLANPEKEMKYFRFNFPLKSLCELFWLALYKNLEKTLTRKMTSKDFIETLYLKSSINSSLYDAIKAKEEISQSDISFVANELILYLNRNKFVHVFLVDAPVFSAPMVVTNPNDLKNSNAYVVIENETKFTHISKLPVEDILTWKLFVYDRLKTQNAGEQIDYKPAQHHKILP